MKCKQCRKSFYEYLDETLPPGKRRSVEEHLERCHDCREALFGEREFSKSASDLLRVETDSLSLRPSVEGDVRKALESGAPWPRFRKRRRWLLRPALALGGAACLLTVAVVALRKHEPKPVEPVAHRPESYAMCMSTKYADEARTDWIERRLIVEARNGCERYLKIIARKPAKTDQNG